ncbi:MAG TPA: serine/threonine-protein kinase, partial [Mobilitalea sp.]|nr:serine/threonine-protein kinase [Mobilitalea sp.]
MQEEIWFQKYRIIRLLGSGGTAQVYLAEHIRLNSFRAIKFIKHEHPFYNLQLKEAQILKNLKHSCIPIIYDIEENEDGSYIIEQYLEGDTLASYVNTRGTINYDIIIHFALQLCDLIQYLHSIDRPILYLDLKPENIIITGETCKLVDFGSAIYRDEAYAGQDYYATKGYAAPELYHHTDIDERCDVYGIGMLLYYMATGVPVKEDMNNIDFYKQCPNNLRKVINRCLKYNPSERFASVTHLSKQLSVIGKKNIHLHKSGSSVRFAVAGAQPRIGVTHLSFQICSYYIYKDM